ncbi:MBL fold metallo-hydrolase [Arcanobacterium haemolyticum]|uniref:Zn-dependent hydrolase, glyoxylase n=1 Tax=Arcanobacterium haemolyticum (strain ATCC 9345 / DSM 20595 / CCM 5947 / CCUG 17215 / LMG 16163 / NBRC 15585 / NCTC 8452 / 11018) TaxID=644284 RepID=D7BNQ8_ARCHD|nr:MBL fold metallo-hydrolase [Arcanobacterium haemolyticum]ADH92557.1 Zn-dependent hydrolase, glyoxylase [Arcanobacterium haemolyticum DSM 20595]SPT74467.1 hydroxyacylglutathione hydrolase [Arcanobacterium haemolyticum]SQH28709.1 hydroxyacylglutathione hydrolase [Arcanobacterium haemolyticum]
MLFLRYDQTFLQENTYILADDDERVALVVDPGAGSATWVKNTLAELNLTLGAVLLTHGHPDHVWDSQKVAAGAPVYISQPDAYRMEDPNSHLPADPGRELALERLGGQSWVKPENLQLLPAEIFSQAVSLVPGIPLRAVPAPGHTEGSTIFICQGEITHAPYSVMMPTGRLESFMLGGDVIFNGGIGRTDMPGGDEYQMASTLRFIVQVIKPETYIFPGHGPQTMLFHETRHSPFLHSAMS